MSVRRRTSEDAGKRIRSGLMVLIAGVVLMLAALTIVWLRIPPSSASRVARHEVPEAAPTGDELAARTAVVLMGVGGVLLVTLVVAGYSLFRLTRRLAGPRSGKLPRATASDDVWTMHKLADGPPDEREKES
jgi:multisubunit Na+/H+ antiporter MnhB subunit